MKGERHAGQKRPPLFLALHLRARGAPLLAIGIAAVALGGWAMADWLVHYEDVADPERRLPVVVMAPLLGATIMSAGLAGADAELERSTAIRWRIVRWVHVMAMCCAITGALALTGTWEPHEHGAAGLVRNSVGFVGMVALAAVVLGARLAWVPAFGYGIAVYSVASASGGAENWWVWPTLPASSDVGWQVAVGVFLVGLVAYARYGEPARSAVRI